MLPELMKHLSDPKLLLSVAIALAQLGTFLWKMWRESGKRHQMEEIRSEIIKLSEFLAKAGDLADNPDGQQAVETASAERKELVTRLNKLARVPTAAPQSVSASLSPARARPLVARLTLFYLSSSAAGWMLQFNFYFWLLVVGVAIFDDEADDPWMYVFAAVVIAGSWLLARAVDRPRAQPRERTRAERLLLGFRPAGPIAVVVHVFYWISLFVVIMGTIGVAIQFVDKEPDVWYGVLGMCFIGAFTFAVRSAALVLDQHEPAVEKPPDQASSAASGSG
jgi:hypothetical protein